jgi:hypothetical protein
MIAMHFAIHLAQLFPTFARKVSPYLEHVYVYQNGELAEKDREFLEYYRDTVLPALREELQSLSQQPPPSTASRFEQEVYKKSLHAKQKEIEALRKLISRS